MIRGGEEEGTTGLYLFADERERERDRKPFILFEQFQSTAYRERASARKMAKGKRTEQASVFACFR